MARGMIWRDPSGDRWHVDNVTAHYAYLTHTRTGDQVRVPLHEVLPLVRA